MEVPANEHVKENVIACVPHDTPLQISYPLFIMARLIVIDQDGPVWHSVIWSFLRNGSGHEAFQLQVNGRP